jgi:hypothetical protein
MIEKPLLTVIETPYYIGKAAKLLTRDQMAEVVNAVAANPEAGDAMSGAGGIRKFRFAFHEGKGKSGGARIIYLAATSRGRVYLLDIFGKNEKANLTKAERNEMAKVAKAIKGE